MDSIAEWLTGEIESCLKKADDPAPFILWCDRDREWKEILIFLSGRSGFELWKMEDNELVLRERFLVEPRNPRVIWIPKGLDELGYFMVFAHEAEKIFQFGMIEALLEYGLDIDAEDIEQYRGMIKSHVKEWIDRPKEGWKELTLGRIKETIIDDERFVHLLCSTGRETERILDIEQLAVLKRRAVEDFGLPEPESLDLTNWRVEALAMLLMTEAAELCPSNPPGDGSRIIPPGLQRKRVLKLLEWMKKNLDCLDCFEALVPAADAKTPLQFWAKSFSELPPPLSSPIAEKALFQAEVERIARIGGFDELASYLERDLTLYQAHGESFWGRQARNRIPWETLVIIADGAGLINLAGGIQKNWATIDDAISWYVAEGWKVDHAGETLFTDALELPDALLGVRSRLRWAYQRVVDGVNVAFSELLAQSGASFKLDYTGAHITGLVDGASIRNPVAIVQLDAFRLDLGMRLTELINEGEPARRARTEIVRSTIPSVTPMGMAFGLPGISDDMRVEVTGADKPEFFIGIEGFDGNLAVASDRREWLKTQYKLKESSFVTIKELLDASSANFVSAKTRGKLLFVFGNEFDVEGHSGQLQVQGGDFHLDRCYKAIRLLREGGYLTVMVVTDHGFFHWEPASDEVEPKPEGEILWDSRRAVIGRNLKSSTSIRFTLPGNDLDCMVPRSVNAYKTYGKMGFFHGGATLQELVIPVVIARWPQKTIKIKAVVKPIEHITTLAPRIEVEPGQTGLFDGADQSLTGRQVIVKIVQPQSGKMIFVSEKTVAIDPGGGRQTVTLINRNRAEFGEKLEMRLLDADDEEILDTRTVEFRVEMDEFDSAL